MLFSIGYTYQRNPVVSGVKNTDQKIVLGFHVILIKKKQKNKIIRNVKEDGGKGFHTYRYCIELHIYYVFFKWCILLTVLAVARIPNM